MSENQTGAPAPENSSEDGGEREPIPAMQQLLDNPFLLLFIGITIPTASYLIWGIMEVVSVPIAN